MALEASLRTTPESWLLNCSAHSDVVEHSNVHTFLGFLGLRRGNSSRFAAFELLESIAQKGRGLKRLRFGEAEAQKRVRFIRGIIRRPKLD